MGADTAPTDLEGAEAEPATPAQPLRAPGDAVAGHVANYGFMRLNWAGPTTTPLTLVITGAEPADGASILANVVRHLGVPVFFAPATSHSFAERSESLRRQYGTWGARVQFRPGIANHIRRLGDNPHLIIAMEDVASLALSIERSAEGGAAEALARAAERVVDLTMFANKVKLPTMIVSIQKAREFPRPLVDALSTYIGVQPSDDTRNSAMAVIDQGARLLYPASLGLRNVQGAVDNVQRRGKITGWAKHARADRRVNVRVLVSGVLAGEGVADEPRRDLVKLNVGDGNHGFAINIKHLLTDEIQVVQVIATDDNSLIGSAAMTLTTGHAIA